MDHIDSISFPELYKILLIGIKIDMIFLLKIIYY